MYFLALFLLLPSFTATREEKKIAPPPVVITNPAITAVVASQTRAKEVFIPKLLRDKKQTYSVNSYWLTREVPPEQEFICTGDEDSVVKTFLMPLIRWARETPPAHGRIILWHDGESKRAENTFKLLQKVRDPLDAPIIFKSIYEIKDVSDNKDIFEKIVPLYPRIDLLKVFIALHSIGQSLPLKPPHQSAYTSLTQAHRSGPAPASTDTPEQVSQPEKCTDEYCVVSDLDIIKIPATEELFKSDIIEKLNKIGMVCNASPRSEGIENQFQIFKRGNEKLIDALRHVMVDVNLLRIREAKKHNFYSDDPKNRFDQGTLHFPQIVFYSYASLFLYLFHLHNDLILYNSKTNKPYTKNDIDIWGVRYIERKNFYFIPAQLRGKRNDETYFKYLVQILIKVRVAGFQPPSLAYDEPKKES